MDIPSSAEPFMYGMFFGFFFLFTVVALAIRAENRLTRHKIQNYADRHNMTFDEAKKHPRSAE